MIKVASWFYGGPFLILYRDLGVTILDMIFSSKPRGESQFWPSHDEILSGSIYWGVV